MNSMTKQQQERALLLLKKGAELARKSDSYSVKEFMSTTAIWDDVECDGMCWTEEAEDLVADMELCDD